MKNIKFRGWHKEKKVMFDVFGFDVNHVYPFKTEDLEIPPEREEVELMQYTGLKDKNGNEVYEGDILLRNLGYVKQMAYICYEKGIFKCHWFKEWRSTFKKWFPDDTTLDAYSFIKQFEVVGNIYDNPELLQLDKKVQ